MSYTSGRNYPSKGSKTSAGSKGSKKSKHSKARKVWGKIGRVFLTIFLIGVITITLVGGAGAIYVLNFVTPRSFDLSSANLATTTIIYANDTSTNKPTEIARVNGIYNRIWVSINDIPQDLQDAFVCTEDQRFYSHNGVDWKRTAGAFVNVFLPIYSSKQGGSTITQQLINNLSSADKNSSNYGRKVQEIVDSLELEKHYSKQQILESYLNTINLNEGCYGIETAAQNYFGKSVKDLDLAECAALACMPKAPATYDPRTNPAKNAERRKIVLQNMLDQGKISKAEYTKAVNEKLTIAAKKTTNTRGWFEDMVIDDVKADLMSKYGWTQEYANNAIYTKGLRIYTTMNPTVQQTMDKVYKDTTNYDYWNQYEGDEQPQSGMMITDYNGQILGVEGGRGQKSGNAVLNRATKTTRSPGSSLKPLAVYAPALELNKINWSSLISCAQINVDGKLWPANDDGSGYNGSMTVVSGLAESKNTIAINIMNNYLSPDYCFTFLKEKLGFDSLVTSRTSNGKVYSDKTLSLGIGSLTDGVTVREMCGGYEIFGNGGKYIEPYSYTKVTDASGNVLLENKATAKQAISEETAFVMSKLLQENVNRSDGTGQKAAISGVKVGGKTGTTNDHKDRWFCGITPDYVGCVWVGYDTPKDIAHYSTWENPALKAWRAVVSQLPSNTADYPTSDKVASYRYDARTGYITDKGGEVGWYKTTGVLPTAPVDTNAQ